MTYSQVIAFLTIEAFKIGIIILGDYSGITLLSKIKDKKYLFYVLGVNIITMPTIFIDQLRLLRDFIITFHFLMALIFLKESFSIYMKRKEK